MIPLKYHEAAEEELLHEIAYLELRLPGLGRRFYNEIQRVEKLMAQFPESGQEISPGLRRCALRAFPFSLIYSVEKDSLLILAVAHQRRRPGYGLGRSTP